MKYTGSVKLLRELEFDFFESGGKNVYIRGNVIVYKKGKKILINGFCSEDYEERLLNHIATENPEGLRLGGDYVIGIVDNEFKNFSSELKDWLSIPQFRVAKDDIEVIKILNDKGFLLCDS
jgi:hypothetical protein